MSEPINTSVNVTAIQDILHRHRAKIKYSLAVCAHCALCAESCFLYTGRGKQDPIYMPSHKFINSVGTLYKKKGNVDRQALEEIAEIVWERCVLCTRCYCPLGVDIPDMIALGRKICRAQGVLPEFHKEYDGAYEEEVQRG